MDIFQDYPPLDKRLYQYVAYKRVENTFYCRGTDRVLISAVLRVFTFMMIVKCAKMTSSLML